MASDISNFITIPSPQGGKPPVGKKTQTKGDISNFITVPSGAQVTFGSGTQTPEPTKTGVPQKVLDISTKVADFLGAKSIAETYGAEIAKAKATPEQLPYITQPTVKQTLASAGQTALNFVGGGIAKSALVGAKKLSDAQLAAKLGIQGAGTTGAFTGLGQVQEGSNVFSQETGIEALKGAALGGIVGPLLGPLVKLPSSLATRNITPEQYLEQARQRTPISPIPDVGIPPSGYRSPYTFPAPKEQLALPPGIVSRRSSEIANKPLGPELPSAPIQLPEKGVLEAQRKINLPTSVKQEPVTQVTPDKYSQKIEERASAFNSLKDFITHETNLHTGTKYTRDRKGNVITKVIPINLPSDKELTKVWNKAHPDMLGKEVLNVRQKIRKTETQKMVEQPVEQPIVSKQEVKPTPEVQIPKVEPTKVETTQVAQLPVNKTKQERYNKAVSEDPTYVPGTDKEKIDTYLRLTSGKTKEQLNDFIDSIYGVNGKKLPQNLPASSAYKLISEDLSKLTTEQIQRLTNKFPLSKAGQDLQAAKIKSGQILDNPLDVLEKAQSELKDKAEELITKKSIAEFIKELECPF